MNDVARWMVVLVFWAQTGVAVAQGPAAIQRVTPSGGLPPSGGYKAPALSLSQLFENDPFLSRIVMTFVQSGNKESARAEVMKAAEGGNLGAEMLLGEQYIPEQCVRAPNRDVPNCGEGDSKAPQVSAGKNPLGVEASYEEAARWLEKASRHGSGEATEVLAQLITRMHANGHHTGYTATDSTRLHALARSQGFNVEPISAVCYQLTAGGNGLAMEPTPSVVTDDPKSAFTDDELAKLRQYGVTGSLQYRGGTGPGSGDSVLLMRPEGPTAHIRIVLDHAPSSSILLPIPDRRDVIYVQRGDEFLAFPSAGPNLPRFVWLDSSGERSSEVGVSIQAMDGGYAGGGCAAFL